MVGNDEFIAYVVNIIVILASYKDSLVDITNYSILHSEIEVVFLSWNFLNNSILKLWHFICFKKISSKKITLCCSELFVPFSIENNINMIIEYYVFTYLIVN